MYVFQGSVEGSLTEAHALGRHGDPGAIEEFHEVVTDKIEWALLLHAHNDFTFLSRFFFVAGHCRALRRIATCCVLVNTQWANE